MEIILREKIRDAVKALYNSHVADELIQLQETRKDFKGDFTLVVFPLLRFSKNTPEQTGETIGNYLVGNYNVIAGYNVIKGFLNLEIADSWWLEYFGKTAILKNQLGNCKVASPQTILVEYSSPNTNKPLHLGHIRNNLLGFSLYRILSICGHNVIKTNIVNDRGIHICKSMLAWQKFGNGETPETTGIKGDHLVGKYYVLFEKEYKTQIEDLVRCGIDENEARNSAPMMKEAREMLLKWEAGDTEVVELWKRMNSWVYAGFDETYKKLGVDFDKIYYESQTYKHGKKIVQEALEKNVLYSNEDSSIWADLTADGLDQKLLLRSDGTAVYMTQDLGTAVDRYNEYRFHKNIYVVGNEQNYHFHVLKALLKKMGYPWHDGLYHFSYGMVELPEGKMKSREGSVVDADDLIVEMIETAREVSLELGKLSDFTPEEKEEIFRKIGLGALKYFILKVDPKKNMTFNPVESIDFNGNTGPFIQYTYARIKSVFRKAEETGLNEKPGLLADVKAGEKEIVLIKLIRKFPERVSEAAEGYSPALVANYCYELAREYNQFYHDYSILGENDESVRNLRLALSRVTGEILNTGMWMLGIEMPERM
ncbi:MAG: arginine--tRNA ligase [Bacteroidetes bacterium GWE2_41_25]|nr:MAG: arginine--tRNA ligase [Bacteroidetes bacterium GWA2_40_15]OFX92210.1 MAG: arginine--tRNA ligase [Bacteroidetes bacterium GWC2_40_22]OFY02019.1 MAG: arginine--tRNA ligase [Bacteroidetes bacterium GWE2_41_25]HBH82956.1 arginine--tRNA ligase [Bacteroidales bacterium]HBQ83392.1 arginine--tRNA ligase [Bacteroidales bacterium]